MNSDRVHLLGIVSAVLFLAACGSTAYSESVGLAWKPSPSAGATGYNVYYGISGSFTNQQDVGNQTSATINDLQAGSSYFFFATTYDAGGDESGPSEIVTYQVNSAPSALPVSGETFRGQSLAVALAGEDAEGDALTYAIAEPPAHGTLSGVLPSVVYTPAQGYTGADAFTYRVNDGKTDSQPATVSIAVLAPPDITPPSVAVTAPGVGSQVSGSITITVGAADDYGVTRIELYLNGSLAGSASAPSAAFSWDTRAFANGTANLQAKAYDQAGHVGVSPIVSVSVQNLVADITPPSVGILSPAANATVSGITQIRIAASDNTGVTRVKCFVNGALLGASTSASPAFPWDTSNYPNGSYTVQAQAFDAAGNSAAASVSGIIVSNTTTTPDTAAPAVIIASPTSGGTIWGTADVIVQAIDDRSVTKVELYFDGELVTSGTSGFLTLALDTTGAVNGAHTLEVRAYDEAANAGSATVEVNVQNATPSTDNSPPIVTIPSPRDGTTVRKNFSVKISASDNVRVARVELYLDGYLAGTSTSRNPTFTVLASKLSSGFHTFVAKGYDDAENEGTSSPVTIRK